MHDPIIVWPPGTFWLACEQIGPYFECTDEFPAYAADGYTVCCWT